MKDVYILIYPSGRVTKLDTLTERELKIWEASPDGEIILVQPSQDRIQVLRSLTKNFGATWEIIYPDNFKES